MKMTITALGVAVFLCAGAASAATRQIDFDFGPLDSGTATSVFGLTMGDSLSGSFTFDDSTLVGAGTYDLSSVITSLDYTTGTKTWDVSDIVDNGNDNIILDGAMNVTQFSFQLGDDLGEYGYLYSNNTALIAENGSNLNLYCNYCSNFEEVAIGAVPLPASFGFVLAGLGGLAVIRRRKRPQA